MEDGVLTFAGIRVNSHKLEVLREGAVVDLEPKAIRVLLHLIEQRDRVVPKDELFEKVWAGVEVTDNALTRVVGQLRKALGDDARQARFVETVPTVGYRFVGVLEEPSLPSSPAPLPDHRARRKHWTWGAAAIAAMLLVGLAFSWPKSKVATNADSPEMRQLTNSQGLDTGPTLSPDGKWLAYASDRSGQFEIYVKPLDGVDRELQVTSDGGPNLEAAWSPDGKWIAYHCVARGGICMIPARGGTVRELAAVGSQPAWSPDSKKIVFRDAPLTSLSPLDIFPYVPGGITILDIESGVRQHLTGGPADNYGYPVWSSDGEWIVHAALTFPMGSRIEAVNLQSGQRNLLSDVKGITCSVRVSADRKRLYYTRFTPPSYFAFFAVDLDPKTMKPETPPQEVVRLLKVPMRIEVSRDDRKLLFAAPDHESNLYRVRPDGSAPPEQLTQGRYFRATGPSFSPDGKKVAYEVRGIGQASQLWMVNSNGAEEERISDPKQPGAMPVWSADGKSIYSTGVLLGNYQRLELAGRAMKYWNSATAKKTVTWQSYSGRDEVLLQHELRGRDFQLSFLNLASGKKREIPVNGSRFGFARLSPQGHRLAGMLSDSGFFHLAILPVAGGAPKQLTSGPEQVYPHAWSPDGRHVSFAGMRRGAWNIYTIDVDSGVEKQITNYRSLRAFVRYPAWSPKNDWIVYEHSDMKGNVYELDLPPR